MKTLMISLLIILGIFHSNNLHSSSPGDYDANKLEQPGSGKLLANWIDIHLYAIVHAKIPNQHFRHTAYAAIAFYESMVGGDDQYRSLVGQLNELNSLPPLTENQEVCWPASGNAALAEIYRYFYADDPSSAQRIDSMENACRQQFLTEGYQEASVSYGSNYGKTIAGAIIEWCKKDGNDQSSAAYPVPKGLGFWEPTPPKYKAPIFPYMGNERTLVAGSIVNTLPPPPTSFSTDPTSPFYKMVEEVYMRGKQLDDEKKSIALFWDDFPDGKSRTAAGHWASILKNEILTRNLSLIESSQIYAEMFIAMHDAIIGCYKAKYTYNLMRPVTFIHKYMMDSTWYPVITTPSHPEYPAAHATISTACAVIMTQLLGNNSAFVDHTYDYLGLQPRSYKNFREASNEAGMSRFYGGIHYIPSIKAGTEQGEKIANNVLKALMFKK